MVLSRLTDADLIRALETLAVSHRRSVASIVEHLAELDSRGAHLDLGHPSLFAYWVTVLGFSEDEACRRIDAARIARKFPCVLRRLFDGSVTLTNLALLKHHLTSENCDELLALVTHQSVRTARERLAARFPVPDVRESLRKQPVARINLSPAVTPTPLTSHERAPSPTLAAPPAPPVPQHHAPAGHQGMHGRIEPLSRDRFQLRVTVSGRVKDNLEQARDLLRHKFPGGELEAVLGEALELLVQRLRAKKFGERRRTPRPRRGTAGTSRKLATTAVLAPKAQESTDGEMQYTTNTEASVEATLGAATQTATGPAVVDTDVQPNPSTRPLAETRREVSARDGARCAFVGSDGRRCSATAFLEFDHLKPAARGGGRDPSNVRCLCRAHNQREAERWFGKAYMASARARTRESAPR